MKLSTLQTLADARSNGRPVALLTFLDDHSQRVNFRDDLVKGNPIDDAVEEAFRRARSQVVETEGRKVFIRVYNPPLRLLIVGAVHIAQPLIEIAKQCDYSITVIDPRKAFATAERFPEVELIWEWPDKALDRLELNERTAVVTLTHDSKLDEPALVAALASDVFYIGALGSRRTHAARCDRLRQSGVAEELLEKIHAPIGMDIGAESPAEIAVSIIAEMTHALHQRAIE